MKYFLYALAIAINVPYALHGSCINLCSISFTMGFIMYSLIQDSSN